MLIKDEACKAFPSSEVWADISWISKASNVITVAALKRETLLRTVVERCVYACLYLCSHMIRIGMSAAGASPTLHLHAMYEYIMEKCIDESVQLCLNALF